MSPAVISILVTALMAVLLISGKFSFGLVTMGCAIILGMTGCLDLATTFAGLNSTSVLLVAAMLVMAGALRKTDLPYLMTKALVKIGGGKDMVLAFSVLLVSMIMELFLPFTVTIILISSIIMMFPENSRVKLYRMLLPLLILGSTWQYSVPIGMGATADMMTNGFAGSIVTDPSQLLNFGDSFKAKIIPIAAEFVYCLFMWRLMPDGDVDLGEDQKHMEVKKSELPVWQNVIIFVLFGLTFVSLIFGNTFGNLMYLIPAASVVIFGFTGIMSQKEIINSVASDVVWLLVGISAVTAALSSSGATALIGNVLKPLLLWTDNKFLILVMVGIVVAIMTMFLSNMGTWAVMTPLVASIAIAAGISVKPLIVMASITCPNAFAFPSGSANCAFIFGMAKYNPLKMLKFTVPATLIAVVFTALSVMLLFPF